MASPGWYPDPSDPSRQRYFDGTKWTENYAPFGPPAPGGGQPAKTGLSTGWIVGIAVGAVFLVLIVISAFADSDKKTETKSDSTATSAARSPATSAKPTSEAPASVAPAPANDDDAPAPVGSSVRDGKFEFQVLGVERSPTKEGIFSPEEAKGEFFIVNLRITNIGDDARSFHASNQHLIVNGNKYDASSSISDDNWMEDINPGLSIEAKVAFDIPPGAVPEAIEVHDSLFSGGALLAV